MKWSTSSLKMINKYTIELFWAETSKFSDFTKVNKFYCPYNYHNDYPFPLAHICMLQNRVKVRVMLFKAIFKTRLGGTQTHNVSGDRDIYSVNLCHLIVKLFFGNLFIFKEKQTQIQIQEHMTCIYNFTQTKYI
jgi:hypothetical protein